MRSALVCTVAYALLLLPAAGVLAQAARFQTAGLSAEGAGPAIAGHLSAPSVQKELNLSAAQISKVQDLRKKMQAEAEQALRAAAGDAANLADLPPDQRAARLRELTTKGQEVAQELSTTYQPQFLALLKPEQAKRWRQISWQAAGPMALADAELADVLELTAEQRQEVTRLRIDFVQRQQQLMQSLASGGPPSPATLSQMSTLSLDLANSLAKLLTPEQRTRFDAALGKKFNVQALQNASPSRPMSKGKR